MIKKPWKKPSKTFKISVGDVELIPEKDGKF